MKRIYKNIISLLLATAMLSGTLPVLGAIDVSFKKRDDGKAEATITGATDVNKVAIAQYNEAGFLINFGISALSGASAVTIADYYANPNYKTKLIPFSNFETLDTQRKGYLVGERTVAEEKFDTAHNMQIARYENTMEIVPGAGVDGSGALHIKRTAGSTSGGHATLNGILSETSDFIVYEFDIKANTANTHNRVQIRGVTDAGATGIEPMILSMHPNEEEGATTLQVTLGSNRTITSTSTNVCTIDVGVYYHLSVVVNYVDHIAKYVFSETDGDIILSMTEPIDPKIGYGAGQDKPYGIRIYAPNSYWRPMHLDFDFCVDNLRVYEGTHPVSDLGDVVYVIDTKSTETVFESDEPYKEKLADTYSLHTRSGIANLNGEKTELRNKPYSKNGEIYVPLSELETAWMIQSGVAAGNDGYCKLSDLAQSLGLNLYIDTNATYNNGLAVIGEDFTFPTGEELQKLNDFAFYMRPTADEVRAVFNARGNSHPRVMADKATFDKIKAQYVDRTNTTFNKWASKVITYANNMLNLSKGGASFQQRWGYKYESGRISGVGNCSWGAFVLAMAYNLTGETRYTDKLYEILETVGEYPNWNPNHHLDAPQIALGFAIAYDWCYDVWKPEQKAFMSKTVHDKLFYESALAYQSTGAKMNNFAVVSGNHNSVCNGGIAASAIAFMDVYPEECAYLLKNAVRGIENSMWNWAPSGSWYEGTGYWNFAMEFTVYMLSSLDVTFGTTYGLENCEGLKTAPEFTINSQTQNGPHNYSDCGVHGENKDLYSPEMLWISQKFGIPEITQTVIMRMPEKLNQEEDTVLGLLWYDTSISDGDTTMPIDAIYDKDNVITMRNNWKQDETSSFVGIHGGLTEVSHSQLDGGSFIFEQGGVRWAIDPGAENYNVPNYWDTKYTTTQANRWTYFRSIVAGHNTLEIDPSVSYTGHDLDSTVKVALIDADEEGAIATADMTEVLSRYTTNATRGYFYTDNRESLVIRDELMLTSGTHDVYWYMLTGEDDTSLKTPVDIVTVAVDPTTNSAILTHIPTGKKMKLEYIVTGGDAELLVRDAEEVRQELIGRGFLTDTSSYESDRQASKELGKTHITLKVTGSGSVAITVMLTPVGLEGATSVSDYNKPIAQWSIN